MMISYPCQCNRVRNTFDKRTKSVVRERLLLARKIIPRKIITCEEMQPLLGCSKIHKSKHFMVTVSQSWLLYLTKSLQKDLGFFMQNCRKCPFSSDKNGILSVQTKNGVQKPSNTLPKLVALRHLFDSFAIYTRVLSGS